MKVFLFSFGTGDGTQDLVHAGQAHYTSATTLPHSPDPWKTQEFPH